MAQVTDHAVLRFVERVLGVDVEAIRRHLANPAVDRATEFGASTVILADGTRLKLRDGAVVTVLPKRRVPKCKRGRNNGGRPQ